MNKSSGQTNKSLKETHKRLMQMTKRPEEARHASKEGKEETRKNNKTSLPQPLCIKQALIRLCQNSMSVRQSISKFPAC
jgi:hypothetical protein